MCIKTISVHAMKSDWGSRGIAPLLLNVCTRWRWMICLTPRPHYPQSESLVPIKQEGGWSGPCGRNKNLLSLLGF